MLWCYMNIAYLLGWNKVILYCIECQQSYTLLKLSFMQDVPKTTRLELAKRTLNLFYHNNCDGLETVALTKRQETEMEVPELMMLLFSLEVTRIDKIRNEYIRGTAQVGRFGEKTRWIKSNQIKSSIFSHTHYMIHFIIWEARMRWSGHVRRKDDGYIGRRMLRVEQPGKSKRGGLKGGLWMRWDKRWQCLQWRRRMQKIGPNGNGKSALATRDGRSRKKKKNCD